MNVMRGEQPTHHLSRRAILISMAAITLLASNRLTPAVATGVEASVWADKLIRTARAQIGVTVRYDGAYVALKFPGGDIPREIGVCTDVVIRAYRDAFGFDLQFAVNADMKRNFRAYPNRWGLSRPDRNIDHRRVPNLQTFFRRKGAVIHETPGLDTYQPGDLITQMVAGRLPHIGIVSDRHASSGRLMIIHNIGAGTQEEDVTAAYPVTGHYRFNPT